MDGRAEAGRQAKCAKRLALKNCVVNGNAKRMEEGLLDRVVEKKRILFRFLSLSRKVFSESIGTTDSRRRKHEKIEIKYSTKREHKKWHGMPFFIHNGGCVHLECSLG